MMKTLARILPLLILLSASAFAQSGYRDQAAPVYQENLSYGYAQVLRVQPAYDSYAAEPRCIERRSGGNTTGGTVIGAIIGGALGNQVGKGDGRKAATIAGAVAGGAIGHSVARNNGSATTVECPSGYVQEQGRIVGYDVEYTYKGEHYMSRLPYDPGDHLRVRVSVTPDDTGS
jgi:uncharacterized protein YcfJ